MEPVRWTAIALLLAYPLCFASNRQASPVDLALHDAEGKKVRLADYRGKVVVVNFWATWCGPCREEMPMIAEVQKDWAPKGVVFLAVSLDEKDTLSRIPKFLQTAHAEMPVWVGASVDDLGKLRLGSGVPDTAFIDERGVIAFRVLGEIRRSELEERLSWLTGDHTAPPPLARVNHMPS